MRGKVYSSLLVFNCLSLSLSVTFSVTPVPAKIKVININKCKAEKEDALTWSYVLNNADADEWKSFDLDAEIFEPITDKFTYSLDVDYFNNGDWENNVFNMGGNMCEMLKKHISTAWTKIANGLGLDDLCSCKTGKYQLRDWQVSREDINFAPMFGRLRLTIKSYNEADENVMCAVALIDISA